MSKSIFKLRNYDKKLTLHNNHITIILQLVFFLDVNPVKHIAL